MVKARDEVKQEVVIGAGFRARTMALISKNSLGMGLAPNHGAEN